MLKQAKTTTNKQFAAANIPVIEAVTENLLRLATEQQAIDWLNSLERMFIISKNQIEATGTSNKKSLLLWIKNYDITKEEKEKGYLGNFAVITYKQYNQKWTLYPTKMFVDVAQHPQRKYVNTSQHPNWGHPILRSIKKKKTYQTLEEAQRDLEKLHEQFPTATIPTKKCLYVMIFSRDDDQEKPLHKYVLEVKVLPEGGFYIDHHINTHKPKKLKTTSPTVAAPAFIAEHPHMTSTEEAKKGFFASREELKRKRKR